MIYNVFGGTLNLALSIYLVARKVSVCLSVGLSNAWIGQNGRKISTGFYTTRKII